MTFSIFITLNISAVQNFIIDKITSIISDKIGTKVEIGHISSNLINTIRLENIYLEDENRDTLLYSEKLDVEFKLLPLFYARVEVDEISLTRPNIYLNTDRNNRLNIQYIIDVFKIDRPQENELKLALSDVEIVDGNVNFKAYTDGPNKIIEYFDPKNISIKNINCRANFFLTSNKHICGSLENLSFREQSGFALEELSTSFTLTDTMATVDYIRLNTERSSIELDSVFLKYEGLDVLKSNIKEVTCNINLSPSYLYLPDFKAFHPIAGNYRDSIFLKGGIYGSLEDLKTNDTHIAYGEELSIDGNVELIGLPDINNTFVYSNVDLKFSKNSLQDIIANSMRKPTILPKALDNLGLCTYKGNITGFISDMVLSGSLRSSIGSIKTDVKMEINESFSNIGVSGNISSAGLNIAKISPKSKVDGLSFNLNTKINAGKDMPFISESKITIPSVIYNNYKYQNVDIEGIIGSNLFEGKLRVDDKNVSANFEGYVGKVDSLISVKFKSSIAQLNLNKLNLIKGYEDMELAANISANFYGSSLQYMNGECNVDSIHIKRENDSLSTKHIGIVASHDVTNHIAINGNLLQGDLFGKFSFESILDDLRSTIGKDLSILKSKTTPKNENQFSFFINVVPTQQLCDIMDIKWHTKKNVTIQGQFSDINKTFYADILIPNISNGKTNINNFSIHANNNNGLDLTINAETKLKKDSLFAGLTVNVTDDVILTSVKFNNKKNDASIKGELISKTRFFNENDTLNADVSILPSTLILNNKRWDVSYSNIIGNKERFYINNFGARSGEQNISIDGIVSSSPEDSIAIALSQINLNDISDLLPEKTNIHFGGNVSGSAYISNTLSSIPIIEANVLASDFTFNKAYFGTAKATSNFDIDKACLNFDAIVSDDNKSEKALLGGKYYFGKDSLDIIASADRLDMRFLDYYLAGILDNIRGYASGEVHIHGFTKAKTIAIDVEAIAEEAQVDIKFLNTTYYFSDSIYIDKNKILLSDIELMDMEGNTGVLNGVINHNYMRDFSYNINIKTNNMVVLNTNKEDNSFFYGKAYASGDVLISGDGNVGTKITCKAQTEANSKVTIPMDSYYAADNSFITFIGSKTPEMEEEKKTTEIINNNILLDLMLDLNPLADISLLINSKTGDMLNANGNGNIRVTYDLNNNDMKMYGNYTISDGKYIFSFQNALTKEFTVREGSSIAWTGDPVDADIDIKAYYQLTASLADILDENMLNQTSRTSTIIQCLLNLRGVLMQPDIDFDIYLPNVEEEIRSAVDNAINTDELVNRQTISLLVLGKFMGLDYMNNNTANTQNEIYSVVSSTLSSVLNSWASQLFEKWNFGVNYRPGDQGTIADEYEFNFLYTPNNRVTINGNVGYKDDALSKNNFIGDFDIEYKLIESGKLSAKAYTHTNDYNEFKQSYTTQGVGIVYRESFNSGKELWQGWVENTRARKERRDKRKEERKEKREQRKAKRDVGEKQ